MDNINKQKDTDMNMIAENISRLPADNVLNMAKRIAKAAPTLSDLNQEQLQQIVQIVLTQRLTNQLNTAANLAGIDYEDEKTIFINTVGHENSHHTKDGYLRGILKMEQYAARAKINVLELTPAKTDDFIYFLKGQQAPASTRRDVAACSSFFTFLERRHENIRNPFRGTKARPSKKSIKKVEVPSEAEIKIILETLPPTIAAAVSIMAFRGLRVGSLPGLSIRGNRFSSRSKGRDISGELSDKILETINGAKLELRKPFAEFTDNAIKKRMSYYMALLRKSNKINAVYSCHDFRHFFAVSEYKKHKDIHRLSKLLGHASIQVTETYLKSLGEVDA